MSERYLIVNADDFGQSPGINKGIIQCFEKGIVTSASLMVRYESSSAAAAYAIKNPELSVGLHADLGEWTLKDAQWEPLYEVVSLDDQEAVKKELSSQLEKFKQLTGKYPSHLDSHQHVHKKEKLLPHFKKIAAALNIPLRHYESQITYCGNFYGQQETGLPYHSAISAEGLRKTLAHLTTGLTELACHPGLEDNLITLYSKERAMEVATLCNASIRNFLVAENISLTSFTNYKNLTGEAI